MAPNGLNAFIRRLRTHYAPADSGGLTDRDLLDRWLLRRDEAAFETLVWRHGPMVLGVCRRLLANSGDAEDAFQATFLALLRKACGIQRRDALGGWLYRVAYRVALRVRATSFRRASRERPDIIDHPAPDRIDPPWRDLQPVLDEEVSRLAERERVPFVLCYLEGRTNAEAARELRCPVGTVQSRLARARRQLRARLTRRGLAPSATAFALGLAAQEALAVVPTLLVTKLVAITAGRTPGQIPIRVNTLTNGAVRTMFYATLRRTVVAAVVVALAGGGAVVCFRQPNPAIVPVAGPLAIAAAARAETSGVAMDAAPAPADGAARLAALFTRTNDVIDFVPDAWTRFYEFCELGALHARAKHKDAARASFRKADDFLATVNLPLSGVILLAEAQARGGDGEAAQATADRVTDRDARGRAMREVSQTLIRAGKYKEVMAFAEKMDSADSIIGSVVQAMSRDGDLKGALETVKRIRSELGQALALVGTKPGYTDIRMPRDEIGGLVRWQMRAGDKDGARATLARAIGIAEQAHIPRGGMPWDSIAGAQAVVGDDADALQTAVNMQTDFGKVIAFQQVAIGHAEAGRRGEALRVAERMELPLARIESFCRIAVAMARAGERDSARSLLEKAEKEANGLDDRFSNPWKNRTSCLLQVVTARAEIGDVKEALRIMKPAGLGGSMAAVTVAHYQAESGDYAGAWRETDGFAGSPYWQMLARMEVAKLWTCGRGPREPLACAIEATAPAAKAALLLGVLEAQVEKEEAQNPASRKR
jgi:RNA polymerase sigma factor (sigma-70 family)